MPPKIDSVTDSVRICQTMSRRRAPERLPQPDLARALADDHQHDVHDDDAADDERHGDDADEHGEDAVGRRLVDVEKRVRREHAEVVGLRSDAAAARCATRPWHRPWRSSRARESCGLTSNCSPNIRDPNIFRKTPSGMMAKLSCELPKKDPFFSLTPTTRKCRPPILMILSSGSAGPNSLSATSHPRTVTGRARIDFGRGDEPPLFGVEGSERHVVARHALHLRAVDARLPVGHRRARLGLRRDGADVVAELPDRRRFVERDPRIVPDALLVGFRCARPASAGW